MGHIVTLGVIVDDGMARDDGWHDDCMAHSDPGNGAGETEIDMAIDYIEGRNLQTEVLQRMNVDQLNSAATSYRPDLRVSKADSLAWVNMWNRSGHMCRASIMDCGDHAHVTLHADWPDSDRYRRRMLLGADTMTQITVTLAGRLQYADGNPYCALAGYAVRRDGRELARFAQRDEAEAHARKIAAFIRATGAQVLALPALA